MISPGGRVRSMHEVGAVRPLAHYLDESVIDAAPPARDYTGISTFGYWGNNAVGDCTIAALYDRQQLLAKLTGESFDATNEQALADYRAATGWDGTPGDDTDRGAQMIDILVHAKNVGIAGRQIAGYARVSTGNRFVMEQALNLFTCLYVGAELPKAIDRQGFDWDMPPLAQRTVEDEPDPTRGHAFLLVGYDRLTWRALTWGSSRYNLSNAWVDEAVDECWVVIDDALVRGDRPAPNGFNLDRLRLDLESLR